MADKFWQREYLDKRREASGVGSIECLICRRKFVQVGSHIVQVHGITARKYREKFGLDVKRGILPEDYRQLKSRQVRENGTIDNLKAGKVNWFKKGISNNYQRSKQTMERLKQQSFIKKGLK